jgi:hypothetical protein
MTDENAQNVNNPPPAENVPPGDENADNMSERIDRLGGEPAPDISPEEFARLQNSGSIHLDPQGRVRANRREESDPGVSLRKRRAWY